MATNFPTSLDSFSTKYDNITGVGSADINNLQDAVYALEQKVGIGSYDESLHSLVYNFIFSGQKLWLYEASAPTGWATDPDPDCNDCLVAVSGGSASYNAPAAVGGIDWATLVAHTHSISHTHTVNSHYHRWIDSAGNSSSPHYTGDEDGDPILVGSNLHNVAGRHISTGPGPGGPYVAYTLATGYDFYTSKKASFTSGASTQSTSGQDQTTENRPTAAVGIIAVKS